MKIARGEKRVDARMLRALHAAPSRVDVVLGAAGEPADYRRLGLRATGHTRLTHFGGDGLHRRQVVG